MARKDKKAQRDKYKNHVKNTLSSIEATNNSIIEYDDLDKDTQVKLKNEAFFGYGADCTPSQKANRIRQVENMKIGGFTKRDIVYYCKHNWGVSKTNAVHYMNEALENFKQDFRDDIEKETDYQLEMRYNLFRTALKAGKISDAHKIIRDITQITGVYDHKPAIEQKGTEFDDVDEYINDNEELLDILADE